MNLTHAVAMDRVKAVLKILAIGFGIVGGLILLHCLYLSFTLGDFEYGDFLHYATLGRNPDTGAIDFTEYPTGEGPWYIYISAWWLSFACFCISAICFALSGLASRIRRLKPPLKKLANIFGILILGLGVFLLEENVRGQIALYSYLRQLRSQGERLTLAEFDFPKPSKEANGATALVALTNQFNSLRQDYPIPINFLTTIRLVAPGRAIVRCRQPNLGVNRIEQSAVGGGGHGRRGRRSTTPNGNISAEEEPPTNAPIRASWADLDEQVGKASKTLEEVREALAQPSLKVEIDYTQGIDVRLPHLQVTRAAGNWLALTVLDDLYHRDLDAATTNIIAIAALTRFQKDERLIISQTARWQVGLVGLNLTWEALQASGWTDEQLVTLQQTWRNTSVAEQTISAMEVERTFSRDYFEQARRFPKWNQLRISLLSYAQCGCDGGYSAFISDFQDSIHAIAWRLAWLDQDELRFLQRSQLALTRTRDAAERRAWSASHLSDKDFPYARSRYDRWRFLLSDVFTPNAALNVLHVFECETQREMTVAAIAIKRYQLRTGTLPPDLASLVPEYLPQLPLDWMDGKPLRYYPNKDETFVLYSVGVDGRDDGGDPTPIEGGRAYSIWNERDGVWPMPASAAEIDATRKQRTNQPGRSDRGRLRSAE